MKGLFEKLNQYFCSRWHLAIFDPLTGNWEVTVPADIFIDPNGSNINGRQVLMRPDTSVEADYLFVDNISWSAARRQHQNGFGKWKPGRMIVQTSLRSYQIWIHLSRKLSLDEKMFWLKKLNNEHESFSSCQWGIYPAYQNLEVNHGHLAGDFAFPSLIWIDFKGCAHIPACRDTSKVSKNPQIIPSSSQRMKVKNICRSDFLQFNEGATDFAYASTLLGRGYSPVAIMKRILAERKDWQHLDNEKKIMQYLETTIWRAKNMTVC